MLDAPFYGALALRLKLVHDPRKAQGTCATDGRALYFAATFINEQTPKQLVGLLAHEVMHVANEHCLRREGRNPRDWNIACDHAINNDLMDAGYELPEGGMSDRRFRGWASEEVFEVTKRAQSEKPTGCGGFPGKPQDGEQGESQSGGAPSDKPADDDKESDKPQGGGTPTDSDDDESPQDDGNTPGDGEETESDAPGGGGAGDDDDDDSERLPAGGVLDSPDPVADRAEIQVAIVEAAMCAKAAGNFPGRLQKLVNELTQSKVDFREILREFFQQCCTEDYTLRKPNKRYLSAGVYLPGMQSESTPEIAFFMDTSGSRFSDEQLSQTVGALDECIAQTEPERVHVKACDTEVTWRKTFERGEKLEVETPGGGGTWLQPCFDELAAEGVEPAVCVVLTDGIMQFPEEPPYPVVWLMTTDRVAPWGLTVRLPDVRE